MFLSILKRHECLLLTAVTFGLPLSLLLPEFSVWYVIPKLRVIRYHVFNLTATWPVTHSLLIGCLMLFVGLLLEFRKRRLDELLESVFEVNEEATQMLAGHKEQKDILATCVELLDTSCAHYDQLVLLQDEWRKRTGNTLVDLPPKEFHHPPIIEESASDL